MFFSKFLISGPDKSVESSNDQKKTTIMYLYIGIAIAGALLLVFLILCIVKCCCTCHKSDEPDNKKTGKFGNTKRLSVKVRRTTSWIKHRSLPKAPCDDSDECPSISDDHKLLKDKSTKKKTNDDDENKKQGGEPLATKRNVYAPSPRPKRSSAITPPLSQKTAFNFQPATGEEDKYYSQPKLNSALSTSATSGGGGHTTIELFDLGGKNHTSNVEIVDDDDFDDFGDPDADNFRGKERSYSKLSYTASGDTSHYQGLNPNTLSKQNSRTDVNNSGPNSGAPSPIMPTLPTLRQNTLSLSDSETKSVLYQSLDSPPYQSIEQYQNAYDGHRSSNEYLEPQDGDGYQDMDLAAYSNPRTISSYPYTKQYLSEKQSFSSDTDGQQYVLPNNGNTLNKIDSDGDVTPALPAKKHCEINDADTDYQSDYHATSYLDLTAPDNEINGII